MITIVDYGMGNLGSIRNMLKKAGFDSIISSQKSVISDASKIILPGVGNFNKAMENIENLDLRGILNQKVLEEKVPILGICLGMQLLANQSEEGEMKGLGWIDAEIIKFKKLDAKMRIPHMGWNVVNPLRPNLLFDSMHRDEISFYFVHSYYMKNRREEERLATSFYGIEFTCAVQKDNIYGTQFHPEKSHRFGLQLLRNFANA